MHFINEMHCLFCSRERICEEGLHRFFSTFTLFAVSASPMKGQRDISAECCLAVVFLLHEHWVSINLSIKKTQAFSGSFKNNERCSNNFAYNCRHIVGRSAVGNVHCGVDNALRNFFWVEWRHFI